MFFACGIWCVSDVSSVSLSSEQTEGLTLETAATHYIPQAKNIPYQPLLIKPIFSLLANAEKTVLFKTSLPKFGELCETLCKMVSCDNNMSPAVYLVLLLYTISTVFYHLPVG